MKTKLLFTAFLSFVFYLLSSQVPQSFNYQALARTGAGAAIASTALNVKIGILSDTVANVYIWEELHNVTTNSLGLFSIMVGTGTKQQGSAATFSAINWTATPLYIRTQIYYQGSWKQLWATKLGSVPYSIVSDKATKSDGLTSGAKLSVVSVNDASTDALLEVKRKDGQTVFAVYPDAVNVYVPNGVKGAKGGFAIGGFDAKGTSQDFFRVTPDSIRAYIDNTPSGKGAKGGFAIGGFDAAKGGILPNYFMNVTGSNAVNVVDSAAQILWYPNKQAFLAGKIHIGSADSVGQNSTALGYKSIAMGNYSQAFGYKTKALGDYSTAIGKLSVAGERFGLISIASNAFALGNAAKATGNDSYALGNTAKATGSDSYAFGTGAEATGTRSYSFGSVGIDGSGVPTGTFTKASGNYSVAIGMGAQATGIGSMALGVNSLASGFSSLGIGFGAQSTNQYSTAIGNSANAAADYATAIGYSASASGSNSYAFGSGANASNSYAYAIGKGAIASGNTGMSFGNNSQATNTNSLALGNGAISAGINSTSIGYQSQANGELSIALGSFYSYSYSALPYFSGTKGPVPEDDSKGDFIIRLPTITPLFKTITFSRANIANGKYSIAFGNGNLASGGGMALGSNNDATAFGAVAIGVSNKAVNTNTFSAGYNNLATGYYATAFGNNTYSKAFGSFVIGQFNEITGDSTKWVSTDPVFIVGNGLSSTDRSNAVTIYKNGRSIFLGEHANVSLNDKTTRYLYIRGVGFITTTTVFGIKSYVNRADANVNYYYSGYFYDTGSAGTYKGLYADIIDNDYLYTDYINGVAADIAEYYRDTKANTEPGDVVVADVKNKESVIKSDKAYQTSVVGVISTKPLMVMGSEMVSDEKTGETIDGGIATRLALSGRVPVKVSGENGSIVPGDLLTSSSIPGHAMKWTLLDVNTAKDFDEMKKILAENEKRRNAIIGKALESFTGGGTGKIVVLISLQ